MAQNDPNSSLGRSDEATKIGVIVSCIVAICFLFDHSISKMMYAFGYAQDTISNIWFLRDQYEAFRENINVAPINSDPFHVFELLVWVSIAISIIRLAIGVYSLGRAADIQSKWHSQHISGYQVFLSWLFLGPGTFVACTLGAKFAAFELPLVQQFPAAYVCLEAVMFCIASFFNVEGILVLLQSVFGSLSLRWSRRKSKL